MTNFNVQAFLDVANELVRSDEVERALHFLDHMLPAFYRDHKIQSIVDLKNEILSRLATPARYAAIENDYVIDVEDNLNMKNSLRGKLLIKDVNYLNANGFKPHVKDYGPGQYWLPIILKRECLDFSYEPIILNERPYQFQRIDFEDYLGRAPLDQPYIFGAFEIIEHLWNESEIKTESFIRGRQPDIIHVSTPMYTFDTACTNWRQRELLGHLRAYTPSEFYNILANLFPEYHQDLYTSQIMHSRLVLKTTKYNIPLTDEAISNETGGAVKLS